LEAVRQSSPLPARWSGAKGPSEETLTAARKCAPVARRTFGELRALPLRVAGVEALARAPVAAAATLLAVPVLVPAGELVGKLAALLVWVLVWVLV